MEQNRDHVRKWPRALIFCMLHCLVGFFKACCSVIPIGPKASLLELSQGFQQKYTESLKNISNKAPSQRVKNLSLRYCLQRFFLTIPSLGAKKGPCERSHLFCVIIIITGKLRNIFVSNLAGLVQCTSYFFCFKLSPLKPKWTRISGVSNGFQKKFVRNLKSLL